MRKAEYFMAGEATPLPTTHVLIPSVQGGLHSLLSEKAKRFSAQKREYAERRSWDNLGEARLALAACNKLLDYYPNGVKRPTPQDQTYEEFWQEAELAA